MSEDGPWTPRGREAFRETLLKAVPKWYSPTLHVMSEILVCLVAAVTAFWFVRDLRWYELFAVPAAWLFGNVFEWALHKNVLHVPRPLAQALYDGHTRKHHRIYWHDTMPLSDWRELPFIMLGGLTVTGIVATAVVMGLAVVWAFGWNVGLLFYGTEVLFIMTYELVHLSFHLPAGHPIAEWSYVRKGRAHHALHHDPQMMRRWNFNVGRPLSDWAFGTLYRPPKGKDAAP